MDSEFSSCDMLESTSQHGNSEPCNLPLEYLRNITNNFSNDRLLGGGGFGTVYRGVLPNGEMVAVKKLNSSMLPGVKDKQFENEAHHLMRLKHSNIVLLLGWCTETENIYVEHNGKHICAEKSERLLCLEYMPKGNLHCYLSDGSSGLTWETRYKIIEGICYGLHYLHEESQLNAAIVHMDLKPANILLDNNMVPKIADFGLSRLFNDEKTKTCTISRDGTLGYMAPEYINRGIISKKSDIFSLGVIIIEIVTGQRDYPDETGGISSQEFTELVLKNWRNRLQISPEIDYQQIRRCIQIGLDCVKLDRSKRPTISQVIKMLHSRTFGAVYKDKLAYFRIKELKDILNQLGLPKDGKKQDLVDRVLAILSDEQGQRHHGWGRRNAPTREAVAKVVDDTYRKMQVCSPDLSSRSHSGSDFNHFRPKEESTDFYHVESKVRCLCNGTMLIDNMIKCEDGKCQVWQHITCVLIPYKPTEGAVPDIPPHFYCELCRLSRADPFWVTTGNPLLPVKFMSSGVGNDGASVPQIVEKTFQLSRADRETLQRPEYDLQVWCILINDKVQFRMQWPQYAELQVNGIPVQVMTRPGSWLLERNGRDDEALVTTCSREGINKISLSRVDARTFCFGVRIVRRRTVSQVLNLIPKDGEGESFEDALARVRRCLGGGGATDNADSDSDLEVVTESVTVNLRCPNSGSRMRTAGRFKPCVHMGCFDLETFVELNQRSRKWQCPICLKNYSLENLMIDPYFNRITSLLRNCSEDVNELDVKPDGSWRVKGDAASRDLSQWHMPDGTLCDSKEDTNPGVTSVNEFEREGTSDGHRTLKLGIKKNPDGSWQVSNKAGDKKPGGRNHVQNKKGFSTPKMPMISSPTGSYRDGEDASVNQEGGGIQFDTALNQEFDSFAQNFGQTYNTEDRQQQPLHNAADVIVLSDSDEENDPIVCAPPVYANTPTNGESFPFVTDARSGYPEGYQEDAGVGTSGLGLLSNTGDFEIINWQMPYTQPEQAFQFFGTNTDVGNPFVGPHNSFNIAPEDYSLDCNVGIEDPSAAHDVSICRNSNDVHGSLVDNPLALAGDDPSLQIFLPSQPSTVPLQEELSEHANTPNGVHPDDWRISLTLAAGGGGNEESTSVDGLKSQPKVPPKEAGVEPLLDAASALPSMNNDRCNGSNLNPRRIENIFSHPRQPRSVRPRLCLSLDTDSE